MPKYGSIWMWAQTKLGHIKIALTLLILLLASEPIASNDNENALPSLKKIIAPLSRKATIAMVITDLKSPSSTLFSMNESIYLQPASTMKILTSIIAKQSLNPKKPFNSSLAAYGKQKASTFNGNFVLDIAANPEFKQDDLNDMLNHITKNKIKKINGDIIILKNHFDDIEKVPGTYWDEIDDCYATAVSDISINKNCFLGTLFQTKNGIKSYWPQNSQPIQLDIQMTTNCDDQTNAHTHYPAYGYGVHLRQNPFKKPGTLQGCWNKKVKFIQLKRSIHNPQEVLINAITEHLNKEKIQHNGQIRVTKTKPSPLKKPLWKKQKSSQNLNELIETMLTQSDNHIANQLFKESAYTHLHAPASWENAQKNAEKILSQLNLYDPESSIVDGAGLSRNNKITAHQLQQSLLTIYKNKKLRKLIPLFATKEQASPFLKQRLDQIQIPLYVKSGSLRGTVSLAGFIDPYGKNPKAFTIIINGNKNVTKDYFSIEKSLLTAISKITHTIEHTHKQL